MRHSTCLLRLCSSCPKFKFGTKVLIYIKVHKTALNDCLRIDSQQKAMFDSLCEQFGMSANTAINIFVRQVIRLRRIPFTIAATETDEDIRAKAIQTIREIREDAKNRPELTLDEINAEINAVREARKQSL
ncbi:type II toxin-antitoxin system RelB/DinJ family antitoxin [Prevotella sp. P5-92]|uniref:type II toxin-antitoxin system RelB/DinJ family antitoxin n=1 Tax=Prevotella sp. P5-92 TaxID=2024222 RepID=UPI0021126A2B|nr:type II toxin-antitoxin system RelB/DinJ family antitoxin [Prevotella sp. P5-92]